MAHIFNLRHSKKAEVCTKAMGRRPRWWGWQNRLWNR